MTANLIHEFVRTPKPTSEEGVLLQTKIDLVLRKGAGTSEPFKFSEGDTVVDFGSDTQGIPAGKVIDLWRENGHNRVTTKLGFFREQDLVLAGSYVR